MVGVGVVAVVVVFDTLSVALSFASFVYSSKVDFATIVSTTILFIPSVSLALVVASVWPSGRFSFEFNWDPGPIYFLNHFIVHIVHKWWVVVCYALHNRPGWCKSCLLSQPAFVLLASR